ncbi:ABC transporter substrate-binding protein [Chloroflexota bacterium]
MKRITQWFLVMGLAVAMSLTACASQEKPAPAKPSTPESATQEPSAKAPTLTREQQLVEAAKANKEDEVNFWTHTSGDTENVIKIFEARYPFLKLRVWDSRGGEILAKAAEEAKVGRHSVDVLLLSSEMVDAHDLGLLTEYEYPNTAGWVHQPEHNYYCVYGGANFLTVYNTNLVAPADVPKSFDDLTSTKWAGRTMASTSGEDMPLSWAYHWREGDELNWDKSFSFWSDAIKNTRPKVVSGFTGAMVRLVAGEAALFLAAPSPGVLRLRAKGAPLEVAALESVTAGTSYIALAKDAPHPNSARLFLDWLTDEEGLLTMANPTMELIMDPQLYDKSWARSQFIGLGLDWEPRPKDVTTPENMKKSADFWMKALGVIG